MPIYLYRCDKCKYDFEIISLNFDEGSVKKCPQCGKMAKRKVAAANFSFGWRLTARSHERFGPKDEVERDV